MVIIGPVLLLIAAIVVIVKLCKRRKAVQYQIDLQIAEKNYALQTNAEYQQQFCVPPNQPNKDAPGAGIYAPNQEPYSAVNNTLDA